jgi:hypothetical protein
MKQAGEALGFLERTAAIAAQVQDDAADVFLFQLRQQFRDIGGRAANLTFAPRVGGIEGGVKRGEVNHSDAHGILAGTARRKLDELGLCSLVFQFDFVTDQADLNSFGRIRPAGMTVNRTSVPLGPQ